MMMAILLAAANLVPAGGSGGVSAGMEKAGTGMAKITSDSTYYDRKEGFAYFSGHVTVVDADYLLHADRAYVFMSASNDLRRVVALGNVAITNGTKRAYGTKASYYRDPGMVVLHSGDGVAAEVWDETPSGKQVVRGKKIKFWTGSEQVEVVEAEISAPTSGGLNGVKTLMGGK